MLFGWRGAPFIINILISLIGVLIIAFSGYVAFAPFAILIGAFIAGLLYKNARDGAVFGFIAAAICAFIIYFLFYAILLFYHIYFHMGIEEEFNLFIAVLLSPAIGAVGGFSGEKFFI